MALERAAFRTADGSYVCAENAGNARLVANRPAVGAWEVFEFWWKYDDMTALRTVSRWFVLEESDDESLSPLASSSDDPLALFRVIRHPDDRVSFQGHNGAFWRAENGGGGDLRCNGHAFGDWEKFHLEVPPAGI